MPITINGTRARTNLPISYHDGDVLFHGTVQVAKGEKAQILPNTLVGT